MRRLLEDMLLDFVWLLDKFMEFIETIITTINYVLSGNEYTTVVVWLIVLLLFTVFNT
jgi:hypothetical protein